MQTIKDYKGDAAIYKFSVLENRKAIDITGWKLLAEFGDKTDSNNKIKKASANVVGGSDFQIKFTNAAEGLFEVYIDTNETIEFSKNAYIEVASFTDGNNKDTIYYNEITLLDPKIDWQTK